MLMHNKNAHQHTKLIKLLLTNITCHMQILHGTTDHTIDIGDDRNHLKALTHAFGSGSAVATHNADSHMVPFSARLDPFESIQERAFSTIETRFET
jgi:hypothetical protein